MKVAMIGTGYVGLVTGTCLADTGNEVTCVDINQAKIDALNAGKIPIYEPGLSELVARCRKSGTLNFTTDVHAAVKTAKLVFLAVGTPQADDGQANLNGLWAAVDGFAASLPQDAIVVVKSTVPVGTNAGVAARLKAKTGRDCDVASNPEFLKEGAAIDDFTKPDRVVAGVRREEVAKVLNDLYAPYLRTERPFLVMTPESAEMTKYVANAMLATKISFINEMANVCERIGADINEVRRGIGHDHRIGFQFLFPGVGYGGSCFPKDIRALAHVARQAGLESQMLAAVDAVNDLQKTVLQRKIELHFGGTLAGKRLAMWGLSFKPRTDDIREAPALVLVDRMLALGASICVHDPEAMPNVREIYGAKLSYAADPLSALDNADALAIVTEWNEFRQPNFGAMRKKLKQSVVFDGRNLYEPAQMRAEGFTYYSIGRATVAPQ